MFRRQTRTRIVIAATPQQVWAALEDLSGYPEWNPVLRVRPWRGQRLREGRRAWLSLRVAPVPVVVPIKVEVSAPDQELRWIGGPWGVMRGRHSFVLREVDGGTELVHGEEFAGLLLPVLWPLMESTLDRLYTSINEALAAHVERSNPRAPD